MRNKMRRSPTGAAESVGTIATGSAEAEQRRLHGQEIQEAESQLASANIAIYPVDLNGLVSGMENSAARGGSAFNDAAVSNQASAQVSSLQATHGTMEEVAAQTGGKAYFNQNEIKEGIALAASDEKASYSLGYYPENKKWDGKMRNIKVKVDSRRHPAPIPERVFCDRAWSDKRPQLRAGRRRRT